MKKNEGKSNGIRVERVERKGVDDSVVKKVDRKENGTIISTLSVNISGAQRLGSGAQSVASGTQSVGSVAHGAQRVGSGAQRVGSGAQLNTSRVKPTGSIRSEVSKSRAVPSKITTTIKDDQAHSSVVATSGARRSTSRRSEELEPTRQTVSARRAAWQTRTGDSGSTPAIAAPLRYQKTLQLRTPSSSSLLQMIEEEDKENSAQSAAARNSPRGESPRGVVVDQSRTVGGYVTSSTTCAVATVVQPWSAAGAFRSAPGTLAPGTLAPGTSAPGNSASGTSAPGTSGGRQPTGRGRPVPRRSPPKRVAPGTAMIHEKLAKVCDAAWRKNEIASRSKQERAAEIEVLEERWKNIADETVELERNEEACLRNEEVSVA